MKCLLTTLIVLVALTVTVTVLIAAGRFIFPLPDTALREASQAMGADSNTRLGRRMQAALAEHPGKSGVVALFDGHEALSSRLKLIDAAQQSIDVQYYIWKNDISGMLLLQSLYKASQRGVRIRLLLDDNGITGMDSYLAALNVQQNFKIRIFNPSTVRYPKLAGYAFDFYRMNRRMHNKSLVVDGAAAIVGGRNIGDEYFALGNDVYMVDLDALVIGEVVPQAAASFDEYWNSPSVFPVESIISGTGDISALDLRIVEVTSSAEAMTLRNALDLKAKSHADRMAALEWTEVQLIVDDPIKGQGKATKAQLMFSRLRTILGHVEQKLNLVSAYFIPGVQGTQFLDELVAAGKEVRVLTNAMRSTDVLLVHAGYSKYRRDLLDAGVKLYELKPTGNMTPEPDLQVLPFGLSGGSLHAKTFAIDSSRLFIGSFNFDPRSALLNCEMGFLIESPAMAQRVVSRFDGPLEKVSYRPELTPEGAMIWRESLSDGREVIHQQEPGANWFQQAAMVLIGLLPIEWML